MLTSNDLFRCLISVLFSFFVSILSFDISRVLNILIASSWSDSFTKLLKTGISSFVRPSFVRFVFIAWDFFVAILREGDFYL